MRLFLKNSKILKSVFSVVLVVVIALAVAIPSFAVDNSHFEYVTSIDLYSDTHYSGVASDFDDIHWSKQGTDTIIYNSGGNYKVPIVYYSPEYWTAGQTYRIEFVFGASSIDGMAIALSTVPNLTEGEQTYIANDCPAKSNNSYNYSFVYDGQPYLIFTFIMKSHKSCLISNIDVFTYNPNAVVESQNQQIIEDNSKRDDKLFNNGETYEFSEPDLNEQFSIFDEHKNDLLENGGLITQQNRLVNGVKAFATFFTSFYSFFTENESLQFIPFLMYLSLICSLILLILGLIRSKGDK